MADGVTPSTPCFFTSSSTRGPQIGPLVSDKSTAFDAATQAKGEGLASAFTDDAVLESWVSLKPWIDQVRPFTLSLRRR